MSCGEGASHRWSVEDLGFPLGIGLIVELFPKGPIGGDDLPVDIDGMLRWEAKLIPHPLIGQMMQLGSVRCLGSMILGEEEVHCIPVGVQRAEQRSSLLSR